jgi:hypothetical protein
MREKDRGQESRPGFVRRTLRAADEAGRLYPRSRIHGAEGAETAHAVTAPAHCEHPWLTFQFEFRQADSVVSALYLQFEAAADAA